MESITQQQKLQLYKELRTQFLKYYDPSKRYEDDNDYFLCSIIYQNPSLRAHTKMFKDDFNIYWFANPYTYDWLGHEEWIFKDNIQREIFLAIQIFKYSRSSFTIKKTPLQKQLSTPEERTIDYGLLVVFLLFLSFISLFIYGLNSI